jgi:hypothetical protein
MSTNFEVNYGNKWEKILLSCVILSERHVLYISRTLQWVWSITRQDVSNNYANIFEDVAFIIMYSQYRIPNIT